MLAELVFVTRLLGLMNGTRTIEARVDPAVKSVEIVLDDHSVGSLRAPWRANLDFGPELAPHELTAIARDAEGRELARDTQFINVPRPQAEIGVMFERDRANITWQHIGSAMPKKMAVKLNNKTLASTVTRSVKLPVAAPDALNVLAIDLEFEDGATAHRDVVFGGFSEEVPAELTATLVRERPAGQKDRANCFRLDGQPVAASEVETGEATILFVRGGSAPADEFKRRQLNRARLTEAAFIVPQTSVRFIWPVASGAGNSDLFMTSNKMKGTMGLRNLLLRMEGSRGSSLRFADAVAVAASEALREPGRRAVVLVLRAEEDHSRYQAGIVRRYAERLGVPFFVWSLRGGEKHPAWGEVVDISTNEKMRDAVASLRSELENHRVAWLPLNPYDALRVETTPDCAWEPLAAR